MKNLQPNAPVHIFICPMLSVTYIFSIEFILKQHHSIMCIFGRRVNYIIYHLVSKVDAY